MYCLRPDQVNEKWVVFKNTMMGKIEQFVPMRLLNGNTENLPMWWNKEAGKAVKNKACAWKRYQANRSNHNYREYVKERDKMAKIIRN